MKISQNIKVAVDAVVFGYQQKELSVLLIKRGIEPFKGAWALPGGLVLENESLEHAVERELLEETGVTIDYLEQLYTFGTPKRDPRNRVISVTYFGLVSPNHFKISADTDAAEVQWFPIHELPKLAFDHNRILTTALQRLQNKINYQPIGFELLKKEFPFSDLENLYQTILNQKIDRRNFRKKIMSFGILTETDKIHQPSSGRPAKLFKFNAKKYKELEKKGFHFEIKFA
ncbi:MULTISPECIES: NUDIX domain-containing protein [Tenacibaculum]|uniref:NUDIX hydrolase n=1 Tax=Tenacibaculum mesophilum TaxID=104268 RepID=A0AAE9MPS7_9FLAO|nr:MULTISPECIES: NUDIX domain-containing protein [Tenacibaculum]GFD74013.1 NUDIX hydrolase [Tenacibaculum sp. KUL113]AZJ33687.1 NUDIX hydrolase [Tenacibaculum mesophilum]MCG7501844.1 NUDIX hydrolase [Tenacibaculum sp. Mcav3-52]MCO7185137.1 NUDIX hydrolase [Tenacibaculum sp. XPcli2-G]QFS28928.1 NUDIX domain-containing protein [Tenacibaculum mesophilum]